MKQGTWITIGVIVVVVAVLAILWGVGERPAPPPVDGRPAPTNGAPEQPTPATGEPIRIGATLPLSGDAAVWGKNTQEGIELALEEVNSAGGVLGRPLKVLYEDTQAMPQEGVTAYQRLTNVERVSVIIDDSVSSVTLAMAPMAMRDQVVILATGAKAPKISEAGEFIFRIWNSESYEGEFAAEYAYGKLGLRRAAILFIENDYGVGLEEVFRTEFTKRGGQITTSEGFAQNATDMRTQLTKIAGGTPEALYLVGYPKEIPIAIKQGLELGLNVQLLGTVAMFDPQLIESAGEAAEGLIFPYPRDPSGEHVDRFLQAFREKHGNEPGITADVGYDAVKMIAEAIKLSGGTTGDDIRRGLNMLRDYPGVSGVMTFDEHGDVHKPMGMKMVTGGQFSWRGS